MSVSGEQSGRRSRMRWSRHRGWVVLLLSVGAAVVAAGGGAAGYAIARGVTPVETHTVYCSAPAPNNASVTSGQLLASAANVASPSVVAITARSTDVSVTGSGIVIASDGVILTNNHVIANVAVNGGAITVTFPTGESRQAAVVGRSPENDIAVIKADDVDGLRPAILGSMSNLAAGDQVLVIGSALGEPGTVTAGVISALGRSTCASGEASASEDQDLLGTKPWLPAELTLTNLIQTDAPISEGNSGGALVNTRGEVIGVCTAFTGSGVSSGETGVGFAIRIDVAYDIAKQLLSKS